MLLSVCRNKTFQTPNRKQSMNAKSRLLFQSPLPSTTTPKSTKTASIHLSDARTTTDNFNNATIFRRSVSTTILNETQTVISEMANESVSTPILYDNNADYNSLITDANTTTPIVKKTVEFIIDTEDMHETPTNCSDAKSRYKSEPNLSRISTEHNISSTPISSIARCGSNQFADSKMVKGVSMVNLKWSTPCASSQPNESNGSSSKELSILDDPDFEATPNSESSFDWQIDGALRTPNEVIGRESMSPIRQATQRMSRAMQVSSFS